MPKDYPDWTTNLSYSVAQLYNGPLNSVNSPIVQDISLYTTITISMVSFSGPAVAQVFMLDASGDALKQEFLTAALGDQCIVDIPCVGTVIQVFLIGAANIDFFTIAGTNRQSQGYRNTTQTGLTRFLVLGGNVTANVINQVPAADGLTDYTTLNGLCSISVLMGGATGQIGFQYINGAGGVSSVPILINPTINVWSQAQYIHPRVPIRWFFTSSTTAAGVGIRYAMTGQ